MRAVRGLFWCMLCSTDAYVARDELKVCRGLQIRADVKSSAVS